MNESFENTNAQSRRKALIYAVAVGIAGGVSTAIIAWSRWIPDPLAFHSVMLGVIGAIYLGFAFADGRISIAILEFMVGTIFLILALLGLWWTPICIAIGLVLHGCWDLAHGPHGVSTRLPSWYPPFCAAFDFVFASIFFIYARDLAAR
jgi:uncharacterized protein DUF6010